MVTKDVTTAQCTSSGDPHLTTFDGRYFDHYRVGDYVYTKSSARLFEVLFFFEITRWLPNYDFYGGCNVGATSNTTNFWHRKRTIAQNNFKQKNTASNYKCQYMGTDPMASFRLEVSLMGIHDFYCLSFVFWVIFAISETNWFEIGTYKSPLGFEKKTFE